MTVEHELKKQLAKKHNLTIRQIEDIISSQSAFVSEVMSKKSNRETYTFPAVRVPGLGVFYCPDYFIRNMKKIDKEKSNEVI